MIERSGVGVHSGVEGWVRIAPAPHGTGIYVGRAGHPSVRLSPALSRAIPGATVLTLPGGEVSTPEHLLAAIAGLGITDAEIEFGGAEVPVLDGSSRPWCEAIVDAGVIDGPAVRAVAPARLRLVEAAGGWAEVRPAEDLRLRVAIDYDDGPCESVDLMLPRGDFVGEISWARTFVMERDVARLRAAGRGRGANLHNTVVYRGSEAVANPGGLRGPLEAARHKMVDLLGDLALAGVPLRGEVVVVRGTHALHHDLLHAWLERS